jgi:hypothetical protein
VLEQQDALANLESALANLQSALVDALADPDLAPADERSAVTQRALSGVDEAFAAVEAKKNEAQQWLDAADDRAARQREAERFDQRLKYAVGASEQLRAALDNFIVAIAPLGESGAAVAAAAADFRETMRDSAAAVLDLGARHQREILTSIVPQSAADAEQPQKQSVSA